MLAVEGLVLAHVFVNVTRLGGSEGTFSVESSCYLLLPV